jgi:hypothetical protein
MVFSSQILMRLSAGAGSVAAEDAASRAGVGRAERRGVRGRRGWKRAWTPVWVALWTAAWVAGIAGFAALHGVHLRADFPNHSPWMFDWAKYTDEGWYGDAAVRAHLLGHWYMAGDFNPAVAVPVWPLLEWVVFCFTGVTVEGARALAVGFFFANLGLSWALLRAGPRDDGRQWRWPALLGLSLLVTSPYLYCFSRLAILEPLLTALVLVALNVAVRLDGLRRPAWGAAGVGALAVLAALTKTTAIFLLPALAWAMVVALRQRRSAALKCVVVAGAVFLAGYGLWLAAIARLDLLADYRYYFFVNKYPRPHEWYWPLASLWWSVHGLMWVDRLVVPLAAVMVVGAAIFWRRDWARRLLLDPVAGASVAGIAGMILFMTVQNHPQPRYFAPVAFFLVFLVVRGVEPLVDRALVGAATSGRGWANYWSGAALAVTVVAIGWNGAQTLRYAAHPEYTFVTAAENLTHYIDTHPNGNRLLVSVSGDEIALITHLPALCDDFGTTDLPDKLGAYRPGWFASWNDLDPGTLEDLHTRYSVEQVAAFPALDDPERDELVLFRLHPLAGGKVRDPHDGRGVDLTQPLPEDSIEVDME